jgi:hypothetical protein
MHRRLALSDPSRMRRDRLIGFTLLVVAALLAVAIASTTIDRPPVVFGSDLELYLAATRAALAGSGFYPAEQLAGPFSVEVGVVLYPPTTIALFAPFLVLPAILWWLIPLGLTAWLVVELRPSLLAWGVIALCAAFPQSVGLVVHGNPAMWVLLVLAIAVRERWLSALVLVKPSLLPFALLGIRDARWWITVGVGVVASLAILPLWLDYLRVLGNVQGSLLYSLGDVPLVSIPIVAWLGRRDRVRAGKLAPEPLIPQTR